MEVQTHYGKQFSDGLRSPSANLKESALNPDATVPGSSPSPATNRLLSRGHAWQDLGTSDAIQKHLTPTLLDLMGAENLVVLCGLGTSLGIPGAPTMSDLWTEVKSETAASFGSVVAAVHHPDGDENIEHLLSRCQMAMALKDDPKIAHFVTTAEGVIIKRCSFVAASSSLPFHEAFIRKLARRGSRQPRTRLFTTNYDLAFERAAAATRFIVIDGFSHTHPQSFDGGYFGVDFVRRGLDTDVPDYVVNVFQLLKLHGSLDWEKVRDETVRSSAPVRPLIIFPQNGKFERSYEQPFLEMMSRFQSALRQPNTGLLVIGFGFADSHLSHPIMSAIRSNIGLKLLVVDPKAQEKGKRSPCIDEMEALILAGDRRLALLSSTFEQFVANVPDVASLTDDEIHMQRLEERRGNGNG